MYCSRPHFFNAGPVSRWGNGVGAYVAVVALAVGAFGEPALGGGIDPWHHCTVGISHDNPPDPHNVLWDSSRLPSGAIPGGTWHRSQSRSVTDNRGRASCSSYSGFGMLNPQINMLAEVYNHGAGHDAADCLGEIFDAYRYTGATPGTINATVTIHANVTDPAGTGLSGLNGFIQVFGTSPYIESQRIFDDEWEMVAMYLAGMEKTMVPFGLGPDTGGWATIQLPITFNVTPNEKFYMFTHAYGVAHHGDSVMDASSTVGVTFDDPTQVDFVPEPTSLGMVLLGLAGATRRR